MFLVPLIHPAARIVDAHAYAHIALIGARLKHVYTHTTQPRREQGGGGGLRAGARLALLRDVSQDAHERRPGLHAGMVEQSILIERLVVGALWAKYAVCGCVE